MNHMQNRWKEGGARMYLEVKSPVQESRYRATAGPLQTAMLCPALLANVTYSKRSFWCEGHKIGQIGRESTDERMGFLAGGRDERR